MSPAAEAASPEGGRDGGIIGRIAALGALALVLITVLYLFFASGDDGHKYKLLFETGGQLVKGNEVLIGGNPAGTVDEIKLNDDGQAEVEITVEDPLHEGTSAVIRSTSLSGIANRYVSLTPGPDNGDEIEDGGFITQADTTSPVDLDQLFNTFRKPERKALQDIIQGSATTYAGRGEEANETYRYLSPSLAATTRLFQEVNRDEQVLTNFLVGGSRVVTAVAERRDDLAGLVSNGNQALGAIADQNESLDRALQALPPAVRQGNTTLLNLRLALDDLDPLVEAAKPATKNLAPFLRQFKKLAANGVPVFRDLNIAVNKKGKNNDLADAAKHFAPLRNAADSAVEPAIQAMQDSEETIRFIRPYTPEVMAAVGNLARVSGYYDADGHYARAEPAGLGVFRRLGGGLLDPLAESEQFDDYCAPGAPPAGSLTCRPNGAPEPDNLDIFLRCPGGSTQPAIDASNPFIEPTWPGSDVVPGPPFPGPGPPFTTGDCLATDLPPGP